MNAKMPEWEKTIVKYAPVKGTCQRMDHRGVMSWREETEIVWIKRNPYSNLRDQLVSCMYPEKEDLTYQSNKFKDITFPAFDQYKVSKISKCGEEIYLKLNHFLILTDGNQQIIGIWYLLDPKSNDLYYFHGEEYSDRYIKIYQQSPSCWREGFWWSKLQSLIPKLEEEKAEYIGRADREYQEQQDIKRNKIDKIYQKFIDQSK